MTNQTPESVIAEAMVNSGAPLMHSRVEERVAAALRAANMLREPGVPDAATEELARIKPLFENYSREYPNECNKRVKAEAERDAALAAIARVRARLGDILPDWSDSGVIAVADILAALDGAPEPEWEYGFELIEPDDRNVFEREGDFISAAFAYRAAKKRIDEEHQADLPRLQYLIVRRRKAGPWLRVEGESDD